MSEMAVPVGIGENTMLEFGAGQTLNLIADGEVR